MISSSPASKRSRAATADLERRPPGLRWTGDADGKGGGVRARRSGPLLYLFGIAWALIVLGASRTSHPHAPPWLLMVVQGLVALVAIASAYLMVRGYVNTTRARFHRGKLVVRSEPLPPGKTFEHDASDIQGFIAQPARPEVTDAFVVALVTREGHRIALPIDLDGLLVNEAGGNRAVFGAAPLEHAAYVARRLEDALDIVRREGGHYRIAPGTEASTVSDPTPALADDEERAPPRQGTGTSK